MLIDPEEWEKYLKCLSGLEMLIDSEDLGRVHYLSRSIGSVSQLVPAFPEHLSEFLKAFHLACNCETLILNTELNYGTND